MEEETRKLLVMKWRRVSLVRNPAIRTFFYVRKSEENMDEDLKELRELFPVEAEVEEAFKAEMPGKAANAVKAALRILGKWKEEFPPEVIRAIGTLAKAVGYGKPEDAYGMAKKPKDKDEEEKSRKSEELDVEPMFKAFDKLAKEVKKVRGEKSEETEEEAAEKEMEEKINSAVEKATDRVINEVGEALGETLKEHLGEPT